MLTLALLALLQTADPLAVVVDPVRPDHNILHYDIRLSIPDTGTLIQGMTTVTYRIEGGTGPLRLDFDQTFAIDSILSRGRPVPHAVDDGGGLQIDAWGPRGDVREVVVFYRGSPQDGLFIQDNVHGDRTAFADNWPNRAHHWFPSEDHPSDKATASFAIEVPAGWKAIANGLLEFVDPVGGGRSRWHWRTEHRIPVYTMVIGAGPLTVTELAGSGALSHSLWTFRPDSAFAVGGPFARAERIRETLIRLVGPYPYGKLAHVQSSTRFGGMENSSAIFYAEQGYARRTMGDGVVAHETAHQWFGDAVTAFDWHHLWLSEGFASYFDPVTFQAMGDEARFRRDMANKKDAYLRSEVVGRPVIDTTETRYFSLLNANNYPKGAWILHMLRGEIGDSAFFDGVRAYYATYRDSTALSSDLLHIMEASARRPLRWFFEQWLLQPGYPDIRLDWRYDEARSTVHLAASQVQNAAWGSFALSLPVVIEDPEWVHRGELRFAPGRRDATVALRGVRRPTRVWLDTTDVLATVVVSGGR